MSTDSDGEVYGGRYSLDSPPQDNRVPPSNSRFCDPAHMRPQYHVYSSDVSSSIETMGGRVRGNVIDRNRDRNGVYTEDESDDSRGSSTDFSTTQVPSRVNGHISVKVQTLTFSSWRYVNVIVIKYGFLMIFYAKLLVLYLYMLKWLELFYAVF